MKIINILFLVFFLNLVSQVNYGQKVKKKKSHKLNKTELKSEKIKDDFVPSEKDLIEAEYLFSEGMKYYLIQDYKKSLNSFKASLKFNPKAAATNYKIAECYFKLKSFNEAERFANKALTIDATNEFYHLLVIKIYKKEKLYSKVVEAYENLIKSTKRKESYYFELAASYLFLSKPEKAIEIYNKSEIEFGLNERVIKQKQRIYRFLKQSDNEILEGQKLIDQFPSNISYVISQCKLLLKFDKTDAAKDLLKNTKNKVENFDENPDLILIQASVYKKEGNKEQYYNNLKKAFEINELTLSSRLEVLVNLKLSKDIEIGSQLAKNTVQLYPNTSRANLIYADFLKEGNKKREARKHFLKSVALNGNNLMVWEQVLQYDWEFNEFDSMALHAELALELFPNQPSLYYYSGTANYINKDYEESRQALEYGKRVSTNPGMLSQFNAQLGDVYNKLEEHEKSDSAYDQVLIYDSKNLHVLNNYSYYLSIRNEKLDKAINMCEKLMELAPNDPTYLDTYAWVLFMKGDFKKAKKLLEQALKSTNDATIIEHYGDVLFKLGDNDNAMTQWKKALDIGADDPQKLRQKIADKKL